jgi:hypothetical protein
MAKRRIRKSCIKCKVTKPLSEYYHHPKAKDGHFGTCKRCHIERVAERHVRNRWKYWNSDARD